MRSPRTVTKSSPRSPQLEKARVQQGRPNAAKKKKKSHRWTQIFKPAPAHPESSSCLLLVLLMVWLSSLLLQQAT